MADEERSEPLDGSEDSTEVLTSKDGLEQPVPGFRLLQKIGEGGMGEVYEAEQIEPVQRRVAFKLIKPGLESKEVLARFESEKQALALMSHPNIAQVYDAGTTTDGRPYFVMEFVHGVSVTKYCDKHRLTTSERLTLFTQICEGVQHAHHKGIIHRDLKPSNVLVAIQDSKPIPKIIDFGVAKATSQRLTERTLYTALGQFIGTPEYMSPEQAEMTELDVDTRTDVYSLGVVLYELLVGAQPFESKELRASGFDEMRRKIREDDPPRPSARISTLGEASSVSAKRRRTAPSALVKELQGDLDWITMKAMDKDRTRRYGSPAELAADITRHLKHEPVEAGPPSAVYRATKFVRRHRVGVLIAVTAFLLLLGLTARERIQSVRIAQERDRANQEAETARQVIGFLVGLFDVSDPRESRGDSITAREILDQGYARIENELVDQPLVQARLMGTMGRVYRGLGLYDRARSLLEESLRIREQYIDEHPLEVAQSCFQLAVVFAELNEIDAARPLFKRALSIREDVLGPNHPDVALSLARYAPILSFQGDNEEARRLTERAITIYEESLGPDDIQLAQPLGNLANLERSSGNHEAAKRLDERALAIREKTLGPDHPDVAASLIKLALVYEYPGDLEAKQRLNERALAITEKVYGPDHPYVAGKLEGLGVMFLNDGDYEAARPLLERALVINEKAFGPDDISVGANLFQLGSVHGSAGDYETARAYYSRAIPILEEEAADGSNAYLLHWSLYNLTCIEALEGNRDVAIGYLHQLLQRGYTDRQMWITQDPDLESLHGDPEFEAVIAELRRRNEEA